MSGLAVLLYRDRRPVDPSALRAMLSAIPYRGPDGAWVRVWPSVGLGMGYAKLSVTPEEANEQQPLVSRRTGCVLVADVRLDNRAQLSARLPERPDSTTSDAELVLRAYETWGADAPTRLLGDFAFALWDPRHQRLVLARDTSGQRSLFYRDDGCSFAAASELHQLLQDPAIPVTPNENRIRELLVPLNAYANSREQSETFYQGVFVLPAGHTMVVTPEGTKTWRYWDLNVPELRYRTDDDYADHFRSLFFDVVEARLRSTHPVGALLSGGLDSSTIVGSAQELYRTGRVADRGFTTFSTVFDDDPECDERALIEDIQARYGFEAQFIPPAEFAGQLQLEPRYFAEEPHMTSGRSGGALIQAVAQRGARVVLTGDIADAYVGGSRLVFDSLLAQGHLRSFWRHFRTYRRLLREEESLRDTILQWCLAPMLPLALHGQLAAAHTRHVLVRNWDRIVPGWLDETLQEDLRQRHLAACLSAERNRRFSSPVREQQFRMLYPPALSRSPAGWPIEMTRPFADRRLHEFMLAVPPEQHFEPHPESDLQYAGSKRLIRRAMRGILPESVRGRTTKTIFRAVYSNDLERRWADYEAAFGPSAHPLVVERGYVDQARLWSRLQQLREAGAAADFIYLIHIVGLETWLRGFNQPREQLVSIPGSTLIQPLANGAPPLVEEPVGVV